MKYHPLDLVIGLSFIGESIIVFMSEPESRIIILATVTPILVLAYFLSRWVNNK